MSNISPNLSEPKQKSVLYWFLVFILYMIMAGISTSFIVGQLITYIFRGDAETSVHFLLHPDQFPGKEITYVSIQALASMLLFIGGGWFFLKRENGPLLAKITHSLNSYTSKNLCKAALLMALLIPATLLLEEINLLALDKLIPSDLKNILEKSQEATKAVYDYLLKVPDLSVLLLSIIGLAVIPAIGEELVFRGIIMNLLLRKFNKPVISIWISALVFSLFHGNWDGFLLRILLGGFLGHLYHLSKNIYVPIAAHATNNALSLILGYLLTNKIIDVPFDYSFIEEGTWPLVSIYSILIIGFTLFYLSTKNKNGIKLG